MLLTHAQGMAGHTGTLTCLQTFPSTILPWLCAIPGKFIAVLINRAISKHQTAQQDQLTNHTTQTVEENTCTIHSKWSVFHLMNTCKQRISCAKRNYWLQEMIWRDQRNLYQGGNLLFHMIIFPFPLFLGHNYVRQSPKQRISEASLLLFSQVFQNFCLFFSLCMDKRPRCKALHMIWK